MKILATVLLVLSFAESGAAATPPKPPPTLNSILLEQLKTSHNVQEWFVPASRAVDGLTFEQAVWKQGAANHSVAQLVHHLTFWDKQQLDKFRSGAAPSFSGDNEETFTPPRDKAGWDSAMKQLEEGLTGWDKAVEDADDAKLQGWASTIAHIGTHRAYHTGQILYIRKQQGAWDASKGVK